MTYKDIVNTQWLVTQPSSGLADSVFEFYENGKLIYNTNSSKWDIINGELIISHNNGYAVLKGTLANNKISGQASNKVGTKWIFEGTLIRSNNDVLFPWHFSENTLQVIEKIKNKEQKIFTNRQVEKNNVLNYGIYHPYRGGCNPEFDDFSSKILDLKKSYEVGINYFFNILKDYFDGGFTIVIVPSHDPANLNSGIKTLAIMLAKNNATITDGTNCLIRTKLIPKLSTGGNRAILVHLNSLDVVNVNLIKNRNVLLLDDVTTSNNSLNASKTLLLNAGANSVQAFAIAQTK